MTSMRTLLLILLALLCVTASAQEKQQPKVADQPVKGEAVKEPPAEVVIDAKAAEEIQRADDAATIAALKAENLSLKIANAQVELKKLIDEAQRARDEADAAFARGAIKAGVPGDQVGVYTRDPQRDGSLKLTRKHQAPPK